jgi:poly(3-hydroxybutyrate) depolymerase
MPERPGEKVPYRVYLPGGWQTAAAPMVVVLHGYAATPRLLDDAGGALQREADRHGFVIVAPNGYNGMGTMARTCRCLRRCPPAPRRVR